MKLTEDRLTILKLAKESGFTVEHLVGVDGFQIVASSPAPDVIIRFAERIRDMCAAQRDAED